MRKKLAIQLIILFLVTQTLGLFVADFLLTKNIKTEIVNDNPDDVQNSFGLILYILIFTGIFLLVLKFIKGNWFFLIIEAMSLLGTGTIVFSSIFPHLALTFAVMLIISQNVFRETKWMKNISSTIAVAGVGALLGVSLGVIPIIIFIILLSVYDLIAVFKTKHMVSMAEGIIKKRLAFTFSLPTDDKEFQLGTGDLVIPLVFATGTLRNSIAVQVFPIYFIMPSAILLVSLIGLLWTLDFADKKRIPLPALPPQTVLMIITWIILSLAGF